MSKLEEQLADYFGALHDDDGSGSGDGLRPYAVADSAIAPPPPPDRRRMALVLVGIVVVAALATLGLVRSSEDSAPYVETPDVEQTRPAPPPVPDGWKPVVFDSVQFAVPADWPVSNDITCVDRSKSGVYLALDAPNPDVRGCSSSYSGSSLVVEVYRYGGDGSEFDPAHPSEEGTVLPGTTYLPRTLNGLDAFLVTFSGVPPSYTVVLPDDDLLIQIFQVGVEHEALAAQIIETIGAAPDTPATSVVSTSTTTSAGPVATTGPQGPDLDSSVGGDLDAFCAALEEYRQAGLSTGEQGFPSAAALPIFQRVLEAAPPEFRLPIATIVDWLEAGAPEPIPAEVASAGGQSTTDWAQNCSGSSARTPEERAQAGR